MMIPRLVTISAILTGVFVLGAGERRVLHLSRLTPIVQPQTLGGYGTSRKPGSRLWLGCGGICSNPSHRRFIFFDTFGVLLIGR